MAVLPLLHADCGGPDTQKALAACSWDVARRRESQVAARRLPSPAHRDDEPVGVIAVPFEALVHARQLPVDAVVELHLPRLGRAVDYDAANAPLREQLRQQAGTVGAVVVAERHPLDACAGRDRLLVSVTAKLPPWVPRTVRSGTCTATSGLAPLTPQHL